MKELQGENNERIGYDDKGLSARGKSFGGEEYPHQKGGLHILIKALIVLVIAAIAFAIFAVPVYNKLISKDEEVKAAWSQVQNQYQRRADLIPNFVETVKGYASHEKDTLEGVINARAKATAVNINAESLAQDPEAFAKFNGAQGELSSALSRLMLVVERYPDLKANQNFAELQNQLEGTENRIAVARKDYIASVQEYNKLIRTFPTNIIARIVGLGGAKPSFSANSSSQKAPSVSFK